MMTSILLGIVLYAPDVPEDPYTTAPGIDIHGNSFLAVSHRLNSLMYVSHLGLDSFLFPDPPFFPHHVGSNLDHNAHFTFFIAMFRICS